MGPFARLGYEIRRKLSERTPITTCPNGHDLTESDVVEARGHCPVCGVNLFPGKTYRENE